MIYTKCTIKANCDICLREWIEKDVYTEVSPRVLDMMIRHHEMEHGNKAMQISIMVTKNNFVGYIE